MAKFAQRVALLEPELIRSERLPEPFPGSLDELRGTYDLFDLGLRAVSPYVVFSDHLLQGHVVLHAGEHVIGDFLLTSRERSFPYVRRASARRMAVRS